MKISKNKVWEIVKIVFFFLIVCALVFGASVVCERKDSKKKYNDFFKMSDQVDVLFLGSSHVLNGVNPALLFDEYGITSYNMAMHGGVMSESYWTLINALDYCSPKCVVVDLWSLNRDYHYVDIMEGEGRTEEDLRESVSGLHLNMDCWTMSKNKLMAINDLISDVETQKEFWWDYVLYHDRWSSLSSGDFESTLSNGGYLLGSLPMDGYVDNQTITQSDDLEQCLDKETISTEYLRKVIEECQSRGINVVLTFLPMANSYAEDRMSANMGQKIADEYGIIFVNLLPKELGSIVNYDTDFFDDTHLNINGMSKVTEYLGFSLVSAGIPDHRGDVEYFKWGEIASTWKAQRLELLGRESNLKKELALIHETNANVVIFLKSDSKALHDRTVRKMISEIAQTETVNEAAEQNGPYLFISGGQTDFGAQSGNIEFAGPMQIESVDSVLGNLMYIGIDGFGALYLNGDLDNNLLNMDEHYYDDAQILILDGNGEVISRMFYSEN